MNSEITIDLKALRHNLAEIIHNVPLHEICAVVKANAYNHGISEVVKTLHINGVKWFAVTNIIEADLISCLGLDDVNILVLASDIGCFFPSKKADEIILTVYSIEQIEKLALYLKGECVRCHLEVDSGMSRTGINFEDIKYLVEIINENSNIHIEGIFSHFVAADNPDSSINTCQKKVFESVLSEFHRYGIVFSHIHLANSAGSLHADNHLPTNMVRPGLSLYGIQPCDSALKLRPAMKWTTKIIQLRKIAKGQGVSYNHTWEAARPSIIATLPVGYADGYPRHASNKGYVIINNRRAPIVGNICMDFMMVDVTECHKVSIFDEAILIGQSCNCEVTFSDLANWAGSITYEILCSVGKRSHFRYIDRKEQ